MLAKPMKTLVWHYPMIQFLIKFVYRIVRQLSVYSYRHYQKQKTFKGSHFLHPQPVLPLAGQAPVRGHRHLKILVSRRTILASGQLQLRAPFSLRPDDVCLQNLARYSSKNRQKHDKSWRSFCFIQNKFCGSWAIFSNQLLSRLVPAAGYLTKNGIAGNALREIFKFSKPSKRYFKHSGRFLHYCGSHQYFEYPLLNTIFFSLPPPPFKAIKGELVHVKKNAKLYFRRSHSDNHLGELTRLFFFTFFFYFFTEVSLNI